MNILKKIASKLISKKQIVFPWSQTQVPGQAIFTDTGNYAQLANAGYRQNVTVRSALDINACSIAEIPWIVTRTGDKDKVALDNDLSRFLSRPNSFSSQHDFKKRAVYYDYLDGNSYAHGSNLGLPSAEMVQLRPDKTSPVAGKLFEGPQGFKYEKASGEYIDLKKEDVAHLHTFDPENDLIGWSPLATAAKMVDMSNNGADWNVALLQNLCKPSGIFTSKEVLSDEEFERFTGQFKTRHGGAKNAGSNMLLDGGGGWQQTGLSPVDMDWLKTLNWSSKQISLVFGIPPEMMGDADTKTFSNYKEARRSYYQDTVIPLAQWMVEGYNNWLQPIYGDQFTIALDLSEIIALKEDETELVDRLVKITWMTPNEKRLRMGLEERPDPANDKTKDEREAETSDRNFEAEQENAKVVLNAPAGKDPKKDPKKNPPKKTPNAKPVSSGTKKGFYQFTPFDLDSEEKQVLAFNAIESQRAPFEAAAKKLIKTTFNRERLDVLRAIKKGISPEEIETNMIEVYQDKEPLWKSVIKNISMSVSGSFASDVINTAHKTYSPSLIQKQTTEQTVYTEREDYSEEVSVLVALALLVTTKKKIFGLFTKWKSEGNGSAGKDSAQWKALEKEIDAVYTTQYMEERAVMISGTEVVRGSNMGVKSASSVLEDQGKVVKSIWVSQRDNKVRDTHKTADGQAQRGDPFSVGGEKQNFPGDVTIGATAKNTINCRCFIRYDITEEGQR